MADLIRKLRIPTFQGERMIYEIELRGPAAANDLAFFLALQAAVAIKDTFEEAAHVIAVFSRLDVETIRSLDMLDFTDISADCATLIERLADLMNAPDTPKNKRH